MAIAENSPSSNNFNTGGLSRMVRSLHLGHMAKLVFLAVEHFMVHGFVHVDRDFKIGELDLIGISFFSNELHLNWFFLHNLNF